MSRSSSSLTTVATLAVTGDLTVSGATNTLNFAAGVIGTPQFAVDSVNATSLANTTITGGNVAAGTIQGAKIAATTVLTGNIAATTLLAGNFANATIASADIALGTVTTADFANGAVTGAVIATGTLTGASFGTASVTTAKMASSGIAGSLLVGGGTNMTNLSPGASGLVATVSGGTITYAGVTSSITGALSSEVLGNAGPIAVSTTIEDTFIDTNAGAVPEWYISLEGDVGGIQSFCNPVIDTAGNVYILRGGHTGNSFGIYNQPYRTASGLTSPITPMTYVLVKYNSSGAAQWTAGVLCTVTTAPPTGIYYNMTIDPTDNIYIYVGAFNNANVSTYSAPNAGTLFGTFAPGAAGYLLVKYNSSGVAQWHTKIIGSTTISGQPGLSCDGTNVYIAKPYGAQVDFYSYSTPTTFTGPSSVTYSGTGTNMYIAKYTAATGALNIRTRVTHANMTYGNLSLAAYSGGVLLSFWGLAAATATVLIYSSDGTATGTLWRTIPTAALTSGRAFVFVVRWTTALAGQQSTYIASNDSASTNRTNGVCTDGTNIYVATHATLAAAGTMQVYSDSAGVTPTSFGTLVTYSAGNVENNNPIALVKYNTSLVAQLMTRITLGNATADTLSLNVPDGAANFMAISMSTLSTTTVFVAFSANFSVASAVDIEIKGYTQPGTVISNSRIVASGISKYGATAKYTSALVCQYFDVLGTAFFVGGPLTSANAVYVVGAGAFDIPSCYIYADSGYIFNTAINNGWLIKYNESTTRILTLANGASVPLNKTITMRASLYSSPTVVTITIASAFGDYGLAITTVVMNTIGEAVTLRWNGTYWNVLKSNGCALT